MNTGAMEVGALSTREDEDRELARAVDEAIAEHGDAREAIKALLEKVAFLEAARDRALDLVSRGYVRGGRPRQVDSKEAK